ncbi:MAG: glycosyltransferase family 9 protein [Deltaproteobacteria bacterium]|nr:glycosyltransferase family 9 protein [Deltaproteobacteria bacterium]
MGAGIDPRKILVIRTHRMGDILQVTPMIRGLRERYPGASISVLVAEGFAEALKGNPDVDTVIPFPRVAWIDRFRSGEKIDWGGYREIRDLVRRLRRERFDLVINRQFTDFEAYLTSLIAPAALRGKVMDGQGNIRYADAVTKRVVADTMAFGRNPALVNLVDLSCEVAGVSPSERRLIFSVSPEVRTACRKRLMDRGIPPERPLYGIQPGASRSFKKVENDSLAVVVDYLVERKEGAVLLFGTGEERPAGDTLLRRLGPGADSVLNLMGETTLEELGGFLSFCNLLVTGDTGTVHVAAAVGTPTLSASYGMTYPYETAPYGLGHLILYSDLACAPCDDPDDCPHEMACRGVLRPEVMARGIDLAHALAAGEDEEVRRLRQDPIFRSVRLLYTGRAPVTPPLKLCDLRVEVPPLPVSAKPPTLDRETSHPKPALESVEVFDTLEQIRSSVSAAVDAFSGGDKGGGFQAILPVFDLMSGVIGRIGIAELPSGLLPLLNRLGQVMERMDITLLQELLVREMLPMLDEMEQRSAEDLKKMF